MSFFKYFSLKVLILLFGISLSLFNLVSGGQINGWDIILDSANRNLISRYTFVFTLETRLNAFEFIKIEMPYPLHDATNPLTASIIEESSLDCLLQAEIVHNPIILKTEITSTDLEIKLPIINIYFIQLSFNLEPSTLYAITLSSNILPPIPQINVLNFIKIASVSSYQSTNLDNLIIYDENNLFSEIMILPDAPPSLIVNYQVPSPVQTEPNAYYEVLIDFQRTQSSSGKGFTFEITFSRENSGFQFISTLLPSIPHICTNTLLRSNRSTTPLPSLRNDSTGFTCSVSSKSVQIIIHPALDIEFVLQFSIFIRNPSFTQQMEPLHVRHLLKNSRNVLETGTTGDFLSVRKLTLSSKNIRIGWGIDRTVQIAPGIQIPLIRSQNNAPAIYNAVQFVFSFTRASLPSDPSISFIFQFTIAQNAQVLPGSIIHNFPEFNPPNQIECLLVPNLDIQCSQIGSLQPEVEYFIGFKMYLSPGQDLHNEFSTIQVFSIDPVTFTRVSSMVADQLVPPSIIPIKDSIEFFTDGTSHTAISSIEESSTSTSVPPPHSPGGTLGIVPNANKMSKLLLQINLLPFTTSNSIGFYMITNGNIIEFENSEVTGNYVGVAKTDTIMYSSPNRGQFARLRFEASSEIILQQLFARNNIAQITHTKIKQHASLYADENNLDFYFFFYDQMNAFDPTVLFSFLYNAYTINAPKPFGIRYSVVNWYGGNEKINNGEIIPTFLRIAGFLTESEINQGDARLAVFFTGLEPFLEPDTSSAACSSSVGQTETLCRCFLSPERNSNQGTQNVNLLNRVEIQFPIEMPVGPAIPFQIIIPVKTVVNIFTIHLFLASMQYHNIMPATDLLRSRLGTSFLHPMSVFRLTGSTNLVDTTQLISMQDQVTNAALLRSGYRIQGIQSIDDYQLNLSRARTGEILDSVYVHTRHTEIGDVIRTNTQLSSTQENGAGFTFVTSYNFTDPLQRFHWEGALFSDTRNCLAFSYRYESNDPHRFGVFCALERGSASRISSLSITHFPLPLHGTTVLNNTAFAYSTSTGLLATLIVRNERIGLPNLITSNFNSASPILVQNSQNNRIIWSFTTTNPIPDQGYVQITFSNNNNINQIQSTCYLPLFGRTVCKVIERDKVQNSILFQLDSCYDCPLPQNRIQIYHFNNIVTSTTSARVFFRIETLDANKNIIDATPSQQQYPSPLNFLNQFSTRTFDIMKIEVEYPFINSETSITITFNTLNRRTLNSYENIQLVFPSEFTQRYSIKSIYCKLSRSETQLHSFGKIQVELVTTQLTITLELTSDLEYDDSLPYILKCFNIQTPVNLLPAPLTATLSLFEDTIQILSSTFVLPVFAEKEINTNTAIISQTKFLTIGSISDIIINYNTASLQLSNQFFIRFPRTYLPNLSLDASLRCTVAKIFANCKILSDRYLVIQTVSQSLINSIEIGIHGVYIPDLPTLAQERMFYFAHVESSGFIRTKDKLIFSNFLEGPQSQAQTTNFIQITQVTLENNYISYTNRIRFDFSIDRSILTPTTTTTTTTYRLILTFPLEWKHLLNLLKPQVLLRLASTSESLELIILEITETIYMEFVWSAQTATIPGKIDFLLELIDIPNPPKEMCIQARQSTLYFSSNTDTLSARSVAINNQVEYYPLILGTRLRLQWNVPNENQFFELITGPFLSRIQLIVANGERFTHPLRIQLKDDSLFTLDPVSPLALPGMTQLEFYITYKEKITPLGDFSLQFIRLDDFFEAYSNIPPCPLRVMEILQPIQLNYNSMKQNILSVPKNGISNPLIFSFSDNERFTIPIKIRVEIIQSDNLGVQLQDLSEISLSPFTSYPQSQCKFTSNDNAIIGAQLSLKISIHAIDDQSNIDWSYIFFIQSEIPTLEVIQATYSGAAFQIAPTQFNEISSNSILFRPFCPETGIIYFYIQLDNITQETQTKDTTDTLKLQQYIQNQADSLKILSQSDPQQNQFGYSFNEGSNIIFSEVNISNLLSNKDYHLRSFCMNLLGQFSQNILSTKFTTNSNGGRLQKLNLAFETTLSFTQQIMATCYLSVFFHIPPENIITHNRASCSKDNYDFANSDGQLKHFQKSESNFIIFYIIPNLTSLSDWITPFVRTIASSLTYQFRITQFFSDYAHYTFSEWNIGLIPPTNPFPAVTVTGPILDVELSNQNPSINENFFIDINQENSFIHIDFIRISQKGFLFVGLEHTLQDLSQQNQYDTFSPFTLQKGRNYLNLPMTFNVQLVLLEENESIRITFINLDYTMNHDRFEIFMAVTEENPSIYAKTSAIRKETIITTAQLTFKAFLSTTIYFILAINGFTIL